MADASQIRQAVVMRRTRGAPADGRLDRVGTVRNMYIGRVPVRFMCSEKRRRDDSEGSMDLVVPHDRQSIHDMCIC